jgi:hypothetical protein
MSDFRSSFSTITASPVIICPAGLYLKRDEEQKHVGELSVRLSISRNCKFVVKRFGCNGESVCVENTRCRFGLKVFWNTRLNLLMTKNVT